MQNVTAPPPPSAGDDGGGSSGVSGWTRRLDVVSLAPAEVLSEFRKARPRARTKHLFKARFAWQKLFVDKSYSKSREAKSSLKRIRKDKRKTRCTAYQFCIALDHQLVLAGVPLSTFSTDNTKRDPTRLLRRGERRVWVEASSCQGAEGMPPGVKRRRAVIVREDDSKYFEVPRFAESLRPHLVLCGDRGGSGLPAWQFMLHHLRLCGSIFSDPCHRAARDWKRALRRAKLWSYVLEGQALLTWLHGPWKSDAWFTQTVEAMGEYVHECLSTEDTLPDGMSAREFPFVALWIQMSGCGGRKAPRQPTCVPMWRGGGGRQPPPNSCRWARFGEPLFL